MFNAEWYVRIMPVRAWWEYSEAWALIIVGVCLSTFLAFMVQNNHDLNLVRRELEDMVLTDPLTGLLNRKGFFNEMESIIRRNTPFRLYYIDLNGFKEINDTYGHRDGDAVLVIFKEKMESLLDNNHIFARISGDEFVLVHVGKFDADAAQAFWNHIGNEFGKPTRLLSGAHVTVSFSLGTAVFPEDGTTIDELIHHADKQMYEKKREHYANGPERRRTD